MGDYRRQYSSSFNHRNERGRPMQSSDQRDRRERHHDYNNRNPFDYYQHSRPRDYDRGFNERSHNSAGSWDYSRYARADDWKEIRPSSSQENTRTRRPSVEELSAQTGMDPETLKLMERLRSYKPYLMKRRKDIFDQHRSRELHEELDEIDFCLDVMNDINADTTMGIQTMKGVHNRILELIRNNPVKNVFEEVDLTTQGDEVIDLESDSAVNSESESVMIVEPDGPESPPMLNFGSDLQRTDSITEIPLEAKEKPDWNCKPNNTGSDSAQFTGGRGSVEHRSRLAGLERRDSTNHYSSRETTYDNGTCSRGSTGNSKESRRQTFASNDVSGPSRSDTESESNINNSNWHQKSYGSQPPSNIWQESWNNAVRSTKDQDMRFCEGRQNSEPHSSGDRSSIDLGATSGSSFPSSNNGFGYDANSGISNQNPAALIGPAALMQQMIVSLQLNPEQQKVLAMNILKTQSSLFPPINFNQEAGSTSNSMNSLHNLQPSNSINQPLLRNQPVGNLRAPLLPTPTGSALLPTPTGPALLPTPPGLPFMATRFLPRTGQRYLPPFVPRGGFQVRPNAHHSGAPRFSQFGQTTKECFLPQRVPERRTESQPMQGQESYEAPSKEHQISPPNADSQDVGSSTGIAVCDPRIKAKQTAKTGKSAVIYERRSVVPAIRRLNQDIDKLVQLGDVPQTSDIFLSTSKRTVVTTEIITSHNNLGKKITETTKTDSGNDCQSINTSSKFIKNTNNIKEKLRNSSAQDLNSQENLPSKKLNKNQDRGEDKYLKSKCTRESKSRLGERSDLTTQGKKSSGIAGFRIPKIKKPEQEPVHDEVDEFELDESDEFDENRSVSNDESELPHSQTTDGETDLELTNSGIQAKHKSSVDTDAFLKDFLLKSLSPEKLAKMSEESLKKLMESVKGDLNAKLKMLSADEEQDEDVPSGRLSEETQGSLASSVDVDNKSVRKSRPAVQRKNAKRRSSLERLHDALRDMNYESMMPTGPRRGRTAGQFNNTLEAATIEAVVNQIQLPPADSPPQPGGLDEEGEVVENMKPKRGRKRKTNTVIQKHQTPKLLKAEPVETNNKSGQLPKITKKRGRKPLLKTKLLKTSTPVSESPGKVTSNKSRLQKIKVKVLKKQTKKKSKLKPRKGNGGMVTRSRLTGKSDVANKRLTEIKIEPDYIPSTEVRPENEDPSPFDEVQIPKVEVDWQFEDTEPVEQNCAFSENFDFNAIERDISGTLDKEMCRSEDCLPLASSCSSTFKERLNNLYNSAMKSKANCLETSETQLQLENDEDIQEGVEGILEWVVSTVEFKNNQEMDFECSENLPEFINLFEDEEIDSCDESFEEILNSDSVENLFLPSNNNLCSPEPLLVPNEAADNSSENEHILDDSNEKIQNECSNINSTVTGRDRHIHNLEGHSLYLCANEDCKFTASNAILFKDHASSCGVVSENKQFTCFHCDKKFKSISTLMEHLKIHGRQNQICTLCPFRCWLNIELVKHMKNSHKVTTYKIVKITEDGEAEFLMYPKDVWSKLVQPNQLEENTIMYSSKVQFSPGQSALVPKSCIFPSLVHCALCKYSTKVRSNLIRHFNLHEQAQLDGGSTEVPDEAPVNPVPYLERKELMFDKMTNWAGSSHLNKEKSGVAAEEASRLPQFVLEQFRYLCSVENCKQLTGDDGLLRSHMKALHSEVESYWCPHCQRNELSRNDVRNAVTIDKIGQHLKLHGPRLLKCGHCDYIHIQTRIMEKHVAEKHPEKKPIHFLIRNLDEEGNNTQRRASMEELQRNSSDHWRCTLCRALSSSWEDAKTHCESVHGIDCQFMCSSCRLCSDSIHVLGAHIIGGACLVTEKQASVMIMFSRNEANSPGDCKDEASGMPSMWRRDSAKPKHIRGIYLEELKEGKDAKEMNSKEPKDSERKEPKEKKPRRKSIEDKKTKKPKKKKELINLTKPSTIAVSAISNKVNAVYESTSVPREMTQTTSVPTVSTQTTSVLRAPSQSVPETNIVLLVCPKCKMYKTKSIHDFTIHLYNELQYKRYMCQLCKKEYKCVTEESLKIHVTNDHNLPFDVANHLILLPQCKQFEDYVKEALVLQTKRAISVPEVPITVKKPSMNLKCKHCTSIFQNHHNYKIHLAAKHVAPKRYKCSHCFDGFWNKGLALKHHTKEHPHLEFKPETNPELEHLLTKEFWLTEYGIPSTKNSKGCLGQVEDTQSSTSDLSTSFSDCDIQFKSLTETIAPRHDHGNEILKAVSNKNPVLEFSPFVNQIRHYESDNPSLQLQENKKMKSSNLLVVNPKDGETNQAKRKSSINLLPSPGAQPSTVVPGQYKATQNQFKDTTATPSFLTTPVFDLGSEWKKMSDFIYVANDEVPLFLDESITSPDFDFGPDSDWFLQRPTANNRNDEIPVIDLD